MADNLVAVEPCKSCGSRRRFPWGECRDCFVSTEYDPGPLPSDRDGAAVSWRRDNLRAALLVGEAVFDIPPPKPLLGNVLQQDSLAAVYGPPGSGKTFVSLDVALSVASGRPWRGLDVVDGPVLYVCAEDVPGVAQRARSWRERYGPLGPIAWITRPAPLLVSETISELADIVAERAPALVVFDTLARCIVGADENSASDMGKVVAALARLREASSACILTVHHSGKDVARGMRGSTSLLAAMDTTIECERTRQGVTCVVKKQKNSADGDVMRFALDPEGESAVLVAAAPDTSEFRPTVLMARIVDFLAPQVEPVSQNTILAGVRGDSNGKRLGLSILVREGTVRETGGSRNAKLFEVAP